MTPLLEQLDLRVHELYLAADAEFPHDPEGDADAVHLHCLMVEHDAICCHLLGRIDQHERREAA